jgi:predicted O-methyltransferase YrrM
MNPLLETIYQRRWVEDAEGRRVNPFPTATPQEMGLLLHRIITEHQLDRTIEIGMAYGLSTLAICQAHQDKGAGEHTAIDPTQGRHWSNIGLLNVRRAGFEERCRFLESRSDEALPQLLREGRQFDFAFIDGSHLFDYVLNDFFYLDKMLTVGGYVIFDDLWMPAVRKVLQFILRNCAYEAVRLPAMTGAPRRLARIARRFAQNPLDWEHPAIRFAPNNICLLRKTAQDTRAWDFHRRF